MTWFWGTLLFLVYVVTAKLGLTLHPLYGVATLVWPPAGLALAGLLLGGLRLWPAIALGALIVDATVVSLPVAMTIATGNTLAAVIAAILLRRHAFHPTLDQPRDVTRLLLYGALAGPAVAATVGSLALFTSGTAPFHDLPAIWSHWWIGDMLGVLVATPLLLVWGTPSRLLREPERDRGTLLLVTAALTLTLLGGWFEHVFGDYALTYPVFPLLIWAALQFGPRGSTLMVLTVSTLAVIVTLLGTGPFSVGAIHTRLLNLQAFMGVMAITSLALSAIVAERSRRNAELRAQERVLARRTHELEASERRNAGIVTSLSEGLLLVAGDGRIVQANRSAGRLLARAPGDLLGRDCREILGIGCLEQGAHDQRVTLPGGDAAPRTLRLNAVPMEGEGTVYTLRDTTEEEVVAQMRSDFVAMASHELRTPIAIMAGYVDLLLATDRFSLSHKQRQEMMERVHGQVRRLTRIVDDLLSLSRIESGRLPHHRRSFDLKGLIPQVMQEWHAAAQEKSIALELDLEDASLSVFADPDHVMQILVNLVGNALKYSPPHTVVTVGAQRTGKQVRVTVADQGIGMAATAIPAVFEKFHRIQAPVSLAQRGTGLGLYISRQLAEMQSGAIVACSEVGKGSTFAFTLPAASAHVAANTS